MLKLCLKKWIFVLVLIIASLIIGIRTSIALFHVLFWFLSVFISVNLLWIIIGYFGARLHIKRRLADKLEEGGTLEVETSIKNNGFLLFFNLALEDTLACAEAGEKKRLFLIDYLGPKSCLKFKYKCYCNLRGKYQIGPVSVFFFDPFGMFFFKKTYQVYSELYVYPETFYIKKFPELVKGSLPWFGIETARVSGDDDEFFGIREYRQGDPIKRIHWPSTARNNKLIVKQYQRQSYYKATLIFSLQKDKNLGHGKESVAEYIIKIAASIAKYLLGQGIDISLQFIVHAGEIVHIPFNKGEDHLDDVLRFLTIAKAESNVSLAEVFEEFACDIPNDSTLIALLTDTDWEILSSLPILEAKNVSVIPLVILPATFLPTSNKQAIAREAEVRIASLVNKKPIIFSQGDNLGEVFSSINY